jgi:hypothetical protein
LIGTRSADAVQLLSGPKVKENVVTNSACGKIFVSVAGTAGLALLAATAFADSAATASLVVPIFGPGIAGNVSEGPTTPLCVQGVLCTRPLANAILQFLDHSTHALVGKARSNSSGNFIVSVPDGEYLVHVMTVNFPICPEQTVTVTGQNFALTQINCETGIL